VFEIRPEKPAKTRTRSDLGEDFSKGSIFQHQWRSAPWPRSV